MNFVPGPYSCNKTICNTSKSFVWKNANLDSFWLKHLSFVPYSEDLGFLCENNFNIFSWKCKCGTRFLHQLSVFTVDA
ncbi:hypothetical protein PR048_006335 [Dryococelus australis]|uniref:Uncharacterized protein n=1 Tax=Dryococelus australis TaxID=614101 RepID=A0ABQ9IAP5_9NEOP|nr:hypothetical protein PR048_006335 [Dryococelus australis]